MERLGAVLERAFRRLMPDPFVLALLLTFIAFAAALATSGHPVELLAIWKSYLFEPRGADGKIQQGYLYFAFQMILVLVTGHALASSPPVARLISRVADLARGPRAAVWLVGFVAVCLGLLHWGLGLIGGALVAREVGRSCVRRGIAAHYPLLGAAGYLGLLSWGTGLSGSIPLKAQSYALPEAARFAGLDVPGVPLESTVFSLTNLLVAGTIVLVAPLLCMWMLPRDAARRRPFEEAGAGGAPPSVARWTRPTVWTALLAGVATAGLLLARGISVGNSIFGALLAAVAAGSLLDAVSRRSPPAPAEVGRIPFWLEHAALPAALVAALGLGALLHEAAGGSFRLSFNSLNFLCLFLGIALHGSLAGYARAVGAGIHGAAGIVLQFPFYFGILGILVASGLAGEIAQGMVAASSAQTYPVLTFLSAGLVNLFVPSGGGQWIVQGDIVVSGALQHGAALLPRSILALAWGDAWTNMLQPFWALPLLGITGLRARDLMGYTAAVMLIVGLLVVAWLLIL